MRFLAETKFADGAVFLDAAVRNEVTVVWPERIMSSATKVVQFCLKFGRGMDQSTLVERRLHLMTKWKPSEGE